jgi:hypothetical protein
MANAPEFTQKESSSLFSQLAKAMLESNEK